MIVDCTPEISSSLIVMYNITSIIMNDERYDNVLSYF